MQNYGLSECVRENRVESPHWCIQDHNQDVKGENGCVFSPDEINPVQDEITNLDKISLVGDKNGTSSSGPFTLTVLAATSL